METTDFVDEEILQVNVDEESNIQPANSSLIQNVIDFPLTLEDFDAKLTSLEPLEERIKFLQQFYSWVPIKPEILSKYEKNAETSCAFRERGNTSFKQNKFHDALLNYNLAVMFANAETEELGLAYANRSAVLLKLNDPRGSLEDIEMALMNNYPTAAAQKLKERQSTCQDLLKTVSEDMTEVKLRSEVEADVVNRRKFCDGILFRVKSPNVAMPAAEEFVTVKYDEARGRHLVVTRDIPAGTALIVEKPYASVLKDATRWDTGHCHYCLKTIRRGIPCKGCVFVFYCDDACLKKAEVEYHQFECNCLSHHHINSSPRWIMLAFRIICTVGPQKLFQLFQTQDPVYFDCKEPFGTDPNFAYHSDDYLPIYHLVRHSSALDGGSRYANALQALLLTSLLESHSSFFQEIPDDLKEDFKTFVATLILRHVESIPCNAMTIDEVSGLENVTLKHWYSTEIGPEELGERIRHLEFPQFAAGVYPVCSLMNHSCDPNVARLEDLVHGILSVVATRTIKAGELLATCYGRSFVSESLEKRQVHLLESYYFKCECVACRRDWPCLKEMMSKDPVFCCSLCSTAFPHEDKGSSKFQKCCFFGRSSLKCGLCGGQYVEGELHDQFATNITTTMEAYQLVLCNRPYEAIRKILVPMKYFQFNVRPPFSKFYWNQESFKQALSLMVYFSR